jgi:hypothetical protein
MPEALDSGALSMMQELKDLFDPEHILNPGKLLPEKPGHEIGDTGLVPYGREPGQVGPGVVIHGSKTA